MLQGYERGGSEVVGGGGACGTVTRHLLGQFRKQLSVPQASDALKSQRQQIPKKNTLRLQWLRCPGTWPGESRESSGRSGTDTCHGLRNSTWSSVGKQSRRRRARVKQTWKLQDTRWGTSRTAAAGAAVAAIASGSFTSTTSACHMPRLSLYAKPPSFSRPAPYLAVLMSKIAKWRWYYLACAAVQLHLPLPLCCPSAAASIYIDRDREGGRLAGCILSGAFHVLIRNTWEKCTEQNHHVVASASTLPSIPPSAPSRSLTSAASPAPLWLWEYVKRNKSLGRA